MGNYFTLNAYPENFVKAHKLHIVFPSEVWQTVKNTKKQNKNNGYLTGAGHISVTVNCGLWLRSMVTMNFRS